ncbi:MAG: helix-turn-helix transcriptional regulator [Armatimonadetes bacterium]|nr:helix-turn-helix transcriptional regulator [Armatimonadota bacterium]
MPMTIPQMRALSGPTTVAIFDLISTSGPLTPIQIQRGVRMRSKGVFYHLHKLQEVGLIERIEAGGKTCYRKRSGVDNLEQGYAGPEYEKMAAKFVNARLRDASRRFSEAASLSASQPELVAFQKIVTARVRVSRGKAEAFAKGLETLVREFSEHGSGQLAQLTLVVSPIVGAD